MSEEEVRTVWMSRQELYKIKQEIQATVARMSLNGSVSHLDGSFNGSSSSSSSSYLDSASNSSSSSTSSGELLFPADQDEQHGTLPTNTIAEEEEDEETFCWRGLEGQLEQVLKQRQTTKNFVHRAVLETQRYQRRKSKDGEVDPQVVADICAKCSRHSQHEAHQVALRDYAAVVATATTTTTGTTAAATRT
jgi:hypothetical protein